MPALSSEVRKKLERIVANVSLLARSRSSCTVSRMVWW